MQRAYREEPKKATDFSRVDELDTREDIWGLNVWRFNNDAGSFMRRTNTFILNPTVERALKGWAFLLVQCNFLLVQCKISLSSSTL